MKKFRLPFIIRKQKEVKIKEDNLTPPTKKEEQEKERRDQEQKTMITLGGLNIQIHDLEDSKLLSIFEKLLLIIYHSTQNSTRKGPEHGVLIERDPDSEAYVCDQIKNKSDEFGFLLYWTDTFATEIRRRNLQCHGSEFKLQVH